VEARDGNAVADADARAKEIRVLAESIQYEAPEAAAELRAEAESIQKNRRWTAGGKCGVFKRQGIKSCSRFITAMKNLSKRG
jgi:uncharacterized membrane protein YqiK